MTVINRDRINRRKKRVSSNIHGTKGCPRINVYKSSKNLYVQAIDDDARVTLAAISSKQMKAGKMTKGKVSAEMGKNFAKKLLEQKIKKAIFDRGRYTYNGRIKLFADGLREGGIQM